MIVIEVDLLFLGQGVPQVPGLHHMVNLSYHPAALTLVDQFYSVVSEAARQKACLAW